MMRLHFRAFVTLFGLAALTSPMAASAWFAGIPGSSRAPCPEQSVTAPAAADGHFVAPANQVLWHDGLVMVCRPGITQSACDRAVSASKSGALPHPGHLVRPAEFVHALRPGAVYLGYGIRGNQTLFLFFALPAES